MLGIEPQAPAAAAQVGVPTLIEFFSRDLRPAEGRGRSADVIFANNVLAHVADLNGFVAGIGTLLKPDGVGGDRGAVSCRPDRPLRVRHDLPPAPVLLLGHRARSAVPAARAGPQRRSAPIHGGSLRLYVGRAGHGGRRSAGCWRGGGARPARPALCAVLRGGPATSAALTAASAGGQGGGQADRRLRGRGQGGDHAGLLRDRPPRQDRLRGRSQRAQAGPVHAGLPPADPAARCWRTCPTRRCC